MAIREAMLPVMAAGVVDEVIDSALLFAGLEVIPDRGTGLLEFTHGPLFVVLKARVGQELCREVMRELRPLIDRAAIAASSMAPPMMIDMHVPTRQDREQAERAREASVATPNATAQKSPEDEEISVADDWLQSVPPPSGMRVPRRTMAGERKAVNFELLDSPPTSEPVNRPLSLPPLSQQAPTQDGGIQHTPRPQGALTMPAPPNPGLLALAQGAGLNLESIPIEQGPLPTMFMASLDQASVTHASKAFTGKAVTSVPIDLVELLQQVADFDEAPFLIFHAAAAPFQLESLIALSGEFPPGSFILVWGGGVRAERLVKEAPRATCSFAYLPDDITLDDVIEHCIDTVL